MIKCKTLYQFHIISNVFIRAKPPKLNHLGLRSSYQIIILIVFQISWC